MHLFFPTPHTFLSVIEWADNGSTTTAHKETAMSNTLPLSPLHKCVFMHGNTCTSLHVHRRQTASVWVPPPDVVINVSLQRGSIGRWALPYNGPSLAAYSWSNRIVRGLLFTCLAQSKPAWPPVLTWKEYIAGFGNYKTGGSSRQHFLLHALFWFEQLEWIMFCSFLNSPTSRLEHKQHLQRRH